jgi:hypothetical protein
MACGITNNNIKQQRSCTIDKWYYWVRDWQQQGHFNIFGHLAQTILPTILPNIFWLDTIGTCAPHMSIPHNMLLPHKPLALLVLQGCVKPAPGEAQSIPNDKVYSQDEHTTAQAIYNTKVKSDDKQMVKIATRLAI